MIAADDKQYDAIMKALKVFEKPKKDMFFDVGQRLLSDFLFGFRKSAAPNGEPWAPITHREGKPLRDKGTLRQSLLSVATNSKLEVGTNIKYAAAHNFGFSGKVAVPAHTRIINQAFGKPIPKTVVNVKAHSKEMNIKKREFLGIYDRQKKIIVSAIEKHLKEKSAGAIDNV
jgi:phage gpG-like protein